MSDLRLFAALELPPDVRASLGAWGRRVAAGDPALRAVPDDRLHLTLHFLGERPASEVPALRGALTGLPAAPVVLRTAGALWLAPRRPHVLTCALVCDSGALAVLHAELGLRVARVAPGWAPDGRVLRPHVTVARVHRGLRARQDAVPPAPELAFSAAAVTLVRSRLDPAGARYETLERTVLHTDA